MENPSIKKNYLYSMCYQLLIMILPLITAPYLARVVGAKGTGIYSYSYSIAQYFVYFSMLGISNLGNRSIAKIRENKEMKNKTFTNIYILQIITCTISFIAYIVYCNFVNENKNIAILQGFYVFSAFFDISWFFFGIENFKITVTRQIIIKIFTTVCIFIFVKNTNDLWKYTLILSIGTFIGQVYLFISAKKYVKCTNVNIEESFRYFKQDLILFVPIIATSIYRVMDKIMLGNMKNMSEVGYYENSDKLIMTCLGVIGSLGSVMLPRMTNLVAKGKKEEEKRYLSKSMEITMFIAFAISFGIFSVAEEFIPIFYGKEFLPCINITKFLCISSVFISWANVVRMQYLIPNEEDKIYVTSIVIGAVTNVLINYLLIPRYGANGAAIGTICAELSVMLIQTVCCRNSLDIKGFIKKSVPFFMFGIIMLIIVRMIARLGNGSIEYLIFEIIIGGSVYIIFSIIYFNKTKNEIFMNMIYKIRRKKYGEYKR